MLIRTRLILIGLLPVLLLLLFIAGMMVTQLQLDSFREKATFASDIEKNFFNLFVVAHDIREKNRFERSRQQWPPITQELGQQLPKAREMFSSADESELIETLLGYFEDSQRDFRELEQWLDQHQDRTLNTAQQDYLSSLSERLHISLQSAIPIANRIAAINQENAEAFDKRRENVLASILIFITGVILLILWPLTRALMRSVDHLKTGMNQVALGDLELRIAMTGKDEFAQLARHFNEMISKLAEVTVARETLSAEVAERKQKEVELKDSKDRIEMLLNSVAEGIYGVDTRGNCTFINSAGLRLLGYQEEAELLGKHMHDVIHHTRADGSHYPSDECRLYRCLHSNESVHVSDEVFWHKDGSSFPADYWSRPTKLNGEDSAVVTFFDITERKRAENELWEKEERLALATLQNGVGVWDWNLITQEMVWDDSMYSLYRIRREDFIGTEEAWRAALHPDDLERGDREVNDAITGKKPFDTEFRVVWPNGEVHHIKAVAKVFRDERGTPLRMLGINMDITERKEYEEELKRSNADLEQFSYAVSHDMRQPLRMISSYLQLLERSLAGQLDGEKRDYFNFAIEGAKRIDQMLVELLEYSRVGRMGEPPAWVESRAALDEALQFLQPAIAEAQARLVISGEWPRILASHNEVQRLIQNLIGNAVKFRVAGRVPEITVTSKVVKNVWHLCVSDNGVGIIPDQIKRLFQVFQRLQSREAYEGTGIGLALCRKITEHHKGRIWAESAGEGLGSKFCVVLPVPGEKK